MKKIGVFALTMLLINFGNIFSVKYSITNITKEKLYVKISPSLGERGQSVIPAVTTAGLSAIAMHDCLSGLSITLESGQSYRVDEPCCMSKIKVSRSDSFDNVLTTRDGDYCASDDVYIHKSDTDSFYIDSNRDLNDYEKRTAAIAGISKAVTADLAVIDSQIKSGVIDLKFIANKPVGTGGLTDAIIESIKKSNIDAKKQDKDGNNLLQQLIIANPVFAGIGPDVLSNGENYVSAGLLEEKNKNGDTPLATAAKIDSREWALFLVRHHANVLTSDNNKQTPLHIAALKNDIYLIQLFIKAAKMLGVSDAAITQYLNQADSSGKTAFDLITDLKILSTLITEPLRTLYFKPEITDINRVVSKNGDTYLMAAIKNNLTDLATKLLSMGANPSTKNTDGRTAIFYVLMNMTSDEGMPLLKLLIEKKVDLNLLDKFGVTPLIVATNAKDNKYIDLLVSNGANLNQQDPASKLITPVMRVESVTPLLIAVNSGDNKLVRYLISKGADVNLKYPVQFAKNKEKLILNLEQIIGAAQIKGVIIRELKPKQELKQPEKPANS